NPAAFLNDGSIALSATDRKCQKFDGRYAVRAKSHPRRPYRGHRRVCSKLNAKGATTSIMPLPASANRRSADFELPGYSSLTQLFWSRRRRGRMSENRRRGGAVARLIGRVRDHLPYDLYPHVLERSSSSISLATVTPSLMMRGAPNDFSRTTLRP